MRGVGFEPTNPYGTGALVDVTAITAKGGKLGVFDSKALRRAVTKRDYMTAPSYLGDQKLWDGFVKYVMNEYSRDHARSVLRYAHRYGHLLFIHDLRPVLELSSAKRRHVLAALASLSRYLGRYEEFKELKKRYDIKVEHKIRITARLTDSDMAKLAEWIKRARERLGVFIDFMLATGMRLREAINSYNLIIKLSKENRLDDYYRDGFLEHYRFEEIFIRGKKKVFISYAPREIVTAITGMKPVKLTTLNDRLDRAGLKIRFKEIRKLWASYMTKFLSEPEINLIQGRVSKNVFMQHYFNPNYIPDLKKRLEKGVKSLFMTVTAMTAKKEAERDE